MTFTDEQKQQLAPDPKRDLDPAMTMKQWLDEASAKIIAEQQQQDASKKREGS